jgi:polar amino acid transport system substrate-binding protein
MGENRCGRVIKRAGFAPAALTAAALLVSACGSGTSTSTSTTTPSSAAAAGAFGATKDAALAAEVPKSMASTGSVSVASDATYPPMESITPGTTTIIGMDPDLGHAIGTVLGLKFDFQNVTFNKILLGLKSGQYDLGMSAFTDEKSREQTVDFVDYFKAGTSFVVRSDSSLNLTSLDQICGMTVAVESGTTEQSDASAQSKKCTGAGKKAVSVLAYPTQTQANLTLSAGRAQVMMADTPVAAYQVKLSNGKFKLEGAYGVAPYGIAIPKNSGMAKPIQDAINKLIATGVYQKITAKWGLQSGAITQATINQAVF